MIEQHVKHSKKILAFLALVLALVTGISGTLMLLTDVTPTATNVMTAGDVEITLYEDVKLFGAADTDPLTSKNITADETVTLPDIVPSSLTVPYTITKKPYVKNTGTTDAYVAIELIFWTTGSAVNNNTEALDDGFFGGITLASGWTREASNDWIVPSTSTTPTTSGYNEHHTVLFYGTGIGLTPLAPSTTPFTPSYAFTGIVIPATWGNEIDGVGFNLAVKAYAIQASNVTPGNTATAWQTFFAGQFGGAIDDPATP